MRLISTIILILCFKLAVGQNEAIIISLDLNNNTIVEILNKIENKTPYYFYYDKVWLGDKKITKKFDNIAVENILNDIFENTDINFFISWDNRVILTPFNIIYSDLPKNFFGNQNQVEKTTAPQVQDFVSPIFLEKQENDPNLEIETIRIGKESKQLTQTKYKLTGTIRNAKNDIPIANCAISVKKLNIGALTNAEGFYEIDLTIGLNVVEITSLGYEKLIKNIIIYNDGTLDFSMYENFEQLSEVVIKADAEKNIKDTSTGKEIIDSEETKNIPLFLGERNILKVATTLPGISSTGEASSGINVRGGKTDQNLFLLDEAVIYKPTHFFGLFQALNPLIINDVEIHKGSIPAEFGGRLSSVFDIRSKDASVEKIKGEFSIGPVTANAVVELPIVKNKSGLIIGARGAYSDWILKTLEDSDLNNSQASFYDFTVKYNHILGEKDALKVSAYYSRDEFSISSDSLYGYNNRLFSLKWDHRFNEKHSSSLILANSQYQFDIDFDGSINNNFLLNYEINETDIKIISKYVLNESHIFDYGVSAKYYSIFPGEINPKTSNDIVTPVDIPQENGLESAIFVSDDIKISEKIQLDLGLRYSFYAALGPYSQKVYEEGIPKTPETVIDTINYGNNEVVQNYNGAELRASARYLLTDNLSVKGSYTNTYQYIHTLSNSTTSSPIDIWKLSNIDIKPQQANQISLGLYRNININDYEISLEGFYKVQKNILDYKTGAKLLLNENIETEVLQGDGKAYGIEFLIRKNIGKLNGWLGYTYSRSFFRLDSEFKQESVNNGAYYPSNYDKPHDLSVILNYKLTKRFSFSSNFVYQTGRPITIPIEKYTFNGNEYVLYSERNQFRIPDYYRLDIGLYLEGNHKVNKKYHSFWSLSVYNVLGRNNPYSIFFVTQDGTIKANQTSIFTVPVPSLTYNIKF